MAVGRTENDHMHPKSWAVNQHASIAITFRVIDKNLCLELKIAGLDRRKPKSTGLSVPLLHASAYSCRTWFLPQANFARSGPAREKLFLFSR
jgi:hypothetical protein